VVGFYTDKQGKVRPITRSSGRRKRMIYRSTHALAVDCAMRARPAPDAETWMKHPNRYDAPGIDTPSSSFSPEFIEFLKRDRQLWGSVEKRMKQGQDLETAIRNTYNIKKQRTRFEALKQGKVIVELPSWLVRRKMSGWSGQMPSEFVGEVERETEKAIKFKGIRISRVEKKPTLINKLFGEGAEEFLGLDELDAWLPKSQIKILRKEK